MFAKRHRSYYTKEGYKQVYKPNSPEARSDGYIASRNATEKIGKLFHAAGIVALYFGVPAVIVTVLFFIARKAMKKVK